MSPGDLTAIRSEPAPKGVDPQLWKKLTAELARVVEEQGARGASAVAEGRGSEVRDLMYYPSLNDRLHWTYRNQGDYDLNGEVNISDLTPIAVHYMKRTTDPTWQVNQFADGDGNGEVNISDVTPLGSNLGARVLGYVIQKKENGVGEEFETVDFVPYPGGQPNSGEFEDFVHIIANAQPLHKYRVVPSATVAAPYETGVPSNEVAVTGEIFHQPWEQRSCNGLRNSLSELNGPASAISTWTLDLQGHSLDFSGPVADRYGNVFCTSFTFIPENQTWLEGSTGSVWAVDRAGQVLWRFQTDDAILTSPVLLSDGTVVVQTYRNELIALYPDGKLHWKQQLTTDNQFRPNQLTVDDDGLLYALDSAPSLRRFLYSGTVVWSAPVTLASERITPVITSSLFIVPSASNKLAAYLTSDGSFDGEVTLNASYGGGAMVEPTTVTLWTWLTGAQDLQALPLDVGGNTADYTSAIGEASTTPALNSNGLIVIGEEIPSAVPGAPSTGRLVGVNSLGGVNWDRPLAAVPYGVLACDASNRVYAGTWGDPDDTGFYCIDAAHNVAWFVQTGGFCQGISIAGEGYCAGIYSAGGDAGLGGAFLIGIDEQ